MALLTALFKNRPVKWLVTLALLLAAAPAGAAEFAMRRGINLDAWVTWPPEAKWGDARVLTPFPEWRRTVGEAELKALKADGFDFVRMPVDPAVFLSERTAGFRDRLFEEVRDAARLVNAAGLDVVVDLHAMPGAGDGSLGTDRILGEPVLFDRYVGVVRQMARTLAGEDPAHVALELMNEPVSDCDGAAGEAWQDRLKTLFAAARASAARLALVLSGACWSSADGLAAVDPAGFADNNLLWDFHSYQPFVLTHQGATWAGDFARYVTGIPYPPYADRAKLDAAVKAVRARIRAEAPWTRRTGLLSYLDEQIGEIDAPDKLEAVMEAPFAAVARWADANGIARGDILLGEFGMIRQEYGDPYVMPAAWRAAYARDMIAFAEGHGFAWSIWSYGGAFGVVDAFDGEKAEPDVIGMIRDLPRRGLE